jgi:hypothetical protein
LLAHEAQLARTAIDVTLAQLKANLSKAGDIKLWAHHYPWLTVGVAAASGFTLAAITKGGGGAKAGAAVLSDEERQRRLLLNETAQASLGRYPDKPNVANSLLGSLFSLARTALEASLVTAIREQGERSVAAAANQPPATAAATPAHGPSSAYAER